MGTCEKIRRHRRTGYHSSEVTCDEEEVETKKRLCEVINRRSQTLVHAENINDVGINFS